MGGGPLAGQPRLRGLLPRRPDVPQRRALPGPARRVGVAVGLAPPRARRTDRHPHPRGQALVHPTVRRHPGHRPRLPGRPCRRAVPARRARHRPDRGRHGPTGLRRGDRGTPPRLRRAQLAIYLLMESHLSGLGDRVPAGASWTASTGSRWMPGCPAWSLTSGRPIFFESMQHLAAVYPGFPLDAHVGARVFLPLIASGPPVGFCILGFDEPRDSAGGAYGPDRPGRTIPQALARAQRYDTEAALAAAWRTPCSAPPSRTGEGRHRRALSPGTEGMDVGGDWYDVVETVISSRSSSGTCRVTVSSPPPPWANCAAPYAPRAERIDPEEVISGPKRLLIDLDPGTSPAAATSSSIRRPASPRPYGPGTGSRRCGTRTADRRPRPGRGCTRCRSRGDVSCHRIPPGAGRGARPVHRRTGGAAGDRLDIGIEQLRSTLAGCDSTSLAETANRLIREARHAPARPRHRPAARHPLGLARTGTASRPAQRGA